MDLPTIQRLAPPGVTALVVFLAHSSQWLFYSIEPGPLRKGDAYLFNALVASLLICYWRTCFTDPGRIPRDWWESSLKPDGQDGEGHEQKSQRQRWCRKCETYKAPRAHHCKTCKRCVAKMDHHCVWTANCVSHITLPHFIRFLLYAVISMVYLEYFLYLRCIVLWQKRHLPSYLGPNVYQLTLLFTLIVTNSLTLFALTLLLGRALWSLALNQTTIESWEIERHHALLRRARTLGGFLYGPDGKKVLITHQEFPWDIGIFSNVAQAFGTWNPIFWVWPFAGSLGIETGLSFEHNCIEDPAKPWPPPDPDKMFRAPARKEVSAVAGEGVDGDEEGLEKVLDVDAFRQRQAADLARYADQDGEFVVRRRPFHERLEREAMMERGRVYEVEDDEDVAVESEDEYGSSDDEDETSGKRTGELLLKDDDVGEEGWRNREGERLADFGVDEVAEFYDEDDLPLAEILRRRQKER